MNDFQPGDRVDVTIRGATVNAYSEHCIDFDSDVSRIWLNPSSPDVTVTPHAAGEAEGLDVEAIRARAAAATPGPWYADIAVGDPDHSDIGRIAAGVGWTLAEMNGGNDNRNADAFFIAHARADIPALLAELDRLRAPAGIEAAIEAGIDAVLNQADRPWTGGKGILDAIRSDIAIAVRGDDAGRAAELEGQVKWLGAARRQQDEQLAAARARVADLEAQLAEARAFARWVADELDEPMPPWGERIREKALELAAIPASTPGGAS